jgi:hypothetical protein
MILALVLLNPTGILDPAWCSCRRVIINIVVVINGIMWKPTICPLYYMSLYVRLLLPGNQTTPQNGTCPTKMYPINAAVVVNNRVIPMDHI